MTREAPSITDLAAFVAVADTASFTRAAERLGTGKSNVGKAVQRLESRLDTRLFQRTTRVVRLTEEGETYLQAARKALDSLSEAESVLDAGRDEPAGRVRIDAPVGFGNLLMPVFERLRRRHPKVTLEISLSDRASGAVGEGWDIVLRIGGLPAAGDMTVRKLCDLRLGLYASAGYLAKHARIVSPKDLFDHDAIMFRASSGQLRPWMLLDEGRASELMPPASMIVSDGRAVIDAAIQGFGVAQIFDRVVQPHLASGELQRVLPEADTDGPPMHALIPAGRRMPPKTRVVLDQLIDALRQPAS